MKEQLIEAIKDWGYKVEVVDDNTLSITYDYWLGDVIFVYMDDVRRKMLFYIPRFYEVSRWDIEKLTDTFSRINDLNKTGRALVYYKPIEGDCIAVYAATCLFYTDDKQIILEELSSIAHHLIYSHLIVDDEFAEKWNKTREEEFRKWEEEEEEDEDEDPTDDSNSEPCPTEEEIEAEDAKDKLEIIKETLSDMQCEPDLSQIDEHLVKFQYQGLYYGLSNESLCSVIFISEWFESFDASDLDKYSLIRKIVNYMNSKYDVNLIYDKDKENDNAHMHVLAVLSLPCMHKEYFKEALLKTIDDYIFIKEQFKIALGVFSQEKEFKDNPMLNYDL